MAALRVNILVNYLGQFWMLAMALLFLPLYMRLLGMEAFGLVGLMLSFQGILQLFDFGIGGATNRELARGANGSTSPDATRDLVLSAEIVIWLIAVFIALAMWAGSTMMANHWLHLEHIDTLQAIRAIAVMGIALALLWPTTFYTNCLSGLERQPALNLINAIFATLRYAGVVPVLLLVAPTIEVFLWWSAVVGLGQSVVMAVVVWRILPKGSRVARWSASGLRQGHRFASGLFAIGVLALATSQLDRLMLVSFRPLEEFGYYTLALSVASGLGRMVMPMFNALYPRFSRLVAADEEATLSELYHRSSQYLAVVIAAVSAVLIVFAYEVLLLWTGDPAIANRVSTPMSILVAGSAFNGFVNIPYALQLAHGWTRLALGLNAGSLIIGIPLCLWAVPKYGMVGASLLWLTANMISFGIGVPLMHRVLLRGHVLRWYLRDILPPLFAGLSTALLLNILLPMWPHGFVGMMLLALVSALTFIASGFAMPAVRAAVRKRVSMDSGST